jgi:hypothetical protein
MRKGNQSDKIDTRRLAEPLRLNHLNPVYHGEHGLRSLKELVRSYLTITKNLGRIMTGRRRSIAVGPFLVPASRSTHRAIVPGGSRRSVNRECAGGRSFTTSNSMRCGQCDSKCCG